MNNEPNEFVIFSCCASLVPFQSSDSDYVLECFSDEEGAGQLDSRSHEDRPNVQEGDAGEEKDEDPIDDRSDTSSLELRKLLRRREELERRRKIQEKHRERYQVSANREEFLELH